MVFPAAPSLLFLFYVVSSSGVTSAGRPPRLIEVPQDSVVPKNEPATLNCRADGDPTPDITWLKDGRPIRAGVLRNFLPSGALFFLRVRPNLDGGVYACLASNSHGQVVSRNATLVVAALQTEFKASPQNSWVAEGDTAVLECDPPQGNPAPSVIWKKNGNLIDIKANGRYSLVGQGSLSISQVRQTDEGRYLCIARSIVGSRQSATALLRVTTRPQFTIRPANTTALLGGSTQLSCIAKGDPPPEITWIKIGGPLPLKRVSFDEERFLISNVSKEDSAEYNCVAANKASSIISSATITVLPLPSFTMIPKDVEVQPGPTATAYFGCEAAKSDPTPTLFWFKESVHTLIFEGSRQDKFQVTPQGTLQIDSVTEQDEGYYLCVAIAISGSVVQRVHLKVTPVVELAPPIVLMGPANQSRPLGAVAVLPCIAAGSPLPVVTWYKNGDSFLLDHRKFTDDAGTLRINDLEYEDTGLYDCVASSDAGKYAWKAHLTVSPDVKGSNGFDPLAPRPKAPEKPRIVKVDSSSVTITWSPLPLEQFEEDEHLVPDFSKSRSMEGEGEEPSYIDDDDYEESSPGRERERRDTELDGSSETEAFFKALEKPRRFEQKGLGDVVRQIIEKEEEAQLSEEYEYTDGDDYDGSGKGENESNLVIKSETTTTTTAKTTTTIKPMKRAPASVSLVNPRQFVQPIASLPSPSITYKVEYYSTAESKSGWLLGATNITEETFTLKHMKPNSEYIFFVRAVSLDGGVSAPSPLSNVVKTLHSGGGKSDVALQQARQKLIETIIVILKNVYAVSSTSVRIEWQIVSAFDYVEGFYIYYRRLDLGSGAAGAGNYQMLTVLNAGTSTFQIVGMEKYANYQVFLIPFYKNVEGRPSNYVNVSTLEDVPTAAPQLLEPTIVNSSSIIVKWKPPPASHHNGVILGYQLRVWQSSSLIRNLTGEPQSSSMLLNDLVPGQLYSLQIGSFTMKGIGTFSPMHSLNFLPPTTTPPVSPPLSPEITDNTIPREGGGGGAGIEDDENNIPIMIPPPGAAVNHELYSEAWFIALIGSIVFAMMLAFVFALYLRRCQIASDGDKLKVSTAEIPDGSIPPHYADGDGLWIDQQKKGMHEYENSNNYAVVEERHSPIAYATTTLVNNNHHERQQQHKSSFSVFGEKGGLGRTDFYNKISTGGGGGWSAPHHPNKTCSLNISSQDMKKPPWLMNSSPVNNPGVSSSLIFGANGPCSSSQSSSSHSSSASEALMKHNPCGGSKIGGGKLSLKSNTNGSSSYVSQDVAPKRRRGSGSRPSSRGQGREDDLNEYMDMDGALDPQLSLGGHVLSTFQTPLPGRKHLVVDYSSGALLTSSLTSNSRLNGGYEYAHHGAADGLPQYAHPSHLRNHNHHQF